MRVFRDFINEHRSTIEELYYKRAVETGEFAFTFSVPFKNGNSLFRAFTANIWL